MRIVLVCDTARVIQRPQQRAASAIQRYHIGFVLLRNCHIWQDVVVSFEN
jgi:hypothetical protein